MIDYSTSKTDVEQVHELLGRDPSGRFVVLLRRPDGTPVVIENAPHLEDGTPMPTLYWLVDRSLCEQVSRLESVGGVHHYEEEVDLEALDRAHDQYRRLRESRVTLHDAPQPSGGIGGSRTGVKCLHAHLAAFLCGIKDPVGELVASQVDLGDIVIGPEEMIANESSQ